jgi:hypothetical protein
MEELYKLIEDYLNNRLPEERRQELEHRMEKDEAFRKEVQLHRAMQEEFSDARGWNLYASLQEIMQEDETPGLEVYPHDNRRKSRNWLWVIALCVVGGIFFWYFSNTFEPPPPQPPGQDPSIDATDSPTRGNDPVKEKAEDTVDPQNNPRPKKDSNKKEQMASIDPKSFEPNQTMETYIGSGGTLSTGGMGVRMDPAKQPVSFFLNKEGASPLLFSGRFYGLRPESDTRFVFNVFDNKNTLDPKASIPLAVNAGSSGTVEFIVDQRLKLIPGLYYYQIEHESSGAVLVTGKFFVGYMN